jgi:hypothetical protein
MENNPDYKQFIIGEDIAVLIIRIDRARMCDVQDRYLRKCSYISICESIFCLNICIYTLPFWSFVLIEHVCVMFKTGTYANTCICIYIFIYFLFIHIFIYLYIYGFIYVYRVSYWNAKDGVCDTEGL